MLVVEQFDAFDSMLLVYAPKYFSCLAQKFQKQTRWLGNALQRILDA